MRHVCFHFRVSVKDLVDILKRRGRKEAVEHTTLDYSWGYERNLSEGSGYKMKNGYTP